MSLTDLMKSDADAFLNTNELAETIKYTPYGAAEKSISAVVDRDLLRRFVEGRSAHLGRLAIVYISSDTDAGVASISPGNDKIKMPILGSGDADADWAITKILAWSGGIWELQAQR